MYILQQYQMSVVTRTTSHLVYTNSIHCIVKSHYFISVIEDLREVRSQLIEVEVKWREIGLELGITDPQLETIEANNNDVTSRLTAMLREWLNRSYNTSRYGEPSWQRLSEAVRHRAGGDNPRLADRILQQHSETESHL